VPRIAAQTTSTEALGVVTDATGGVISGAAVRLTRVETGETRSTVTNAQGLYSFPLIEPGEYRITVEAPGFKITNISNIDVLLQQRARVDVALEVGDLTQQIEVTGERRLLNTEDAAVGQNIESKRVVDLPVGYRNVGHLAIMVPGVTFGNRMGRGTGASGRTSPSGTVVYLSANGQSGDTQGITLDGIDIKEPRYNQMTLTPSLDAISEFKVQTAAYSAEFGLAGGAQVQIAMKSGTNQFHGSVYEFLRNSKMDAEDYFLNFQLAPGEERKPKNALRRNQFGAFLSGPVILPGYNGRNRTFWSFNYEGRREVSEAPATGWFPSEEMKRGNFAALLTPIDAAGNVRRPPVIIYDPRTGNPFPNNVIPESRIHPGVRDNLLKYLVSRQFTQADPLDFTNRAAIRYPITQNAWFVRGDHNISSNDRVFGRIAWDNQEWDRPDLNTNFGIGYFNRPKSLAAQWIHIFSPTVLNEFRFGFLLQQTDAFHRRDFVEGFDQDALGIGTWRVDSPTGPRNLLPRENRIPPITGLGASFGDNYGGGLDDIDVYNFSNHIQITRSTHSFKIGIEHRRFQMHRYAANYPGGLLQFSATQTGHGFASFLLGYPDVARTPEGNPLTIPTQRLWSFYVLDDWKITRRLTANIGIRYDHLGVPYDAGGFWRTVDFNRTYRTGDGLDIPTIYPGVLGEAAAVPLFSRYNPPVLPRVGLAYRPWDKWVIRTGAGWYTNVPNLNNYTILNLMPPYSGSREFNSITDPAQQVIATVAGRSYTLTTRRFREGTTPLMLGPNLFSGPARVAPEGLWYISPDRKLLNLWTWSFDIQRELPLQTVLTVGYVGNRGTNATAILPDMNQPVPSPNTDIQRNRPFQLFHDPLRPDVPVRTLGNLPAIVHGLNNFYHALMVSVDKRYSNGFAYGLSYTWSKATGETSATQDGWYGQDPRNFRDGRGPLVEFDRRHVAVVNFVYELPWMKNARNVGGMLLGGWQLNGIIALRSGFMYTVTQSSDLNTGRTVRPDRVADGRLSDRSRELWFDPQAFRRVSCNIPGRLDLCHYGNSGVGIISQPGQRNLDLSAFKNFRITEGASVQFRVEAFNATNTPYFGAPNGISFATPNSLVPDGPRMGEIRSLEAPMRTMQLGLKLFW
jgi:hypothetical protein